MTDVERLVSTSSGKMVSSFLDMFFSFLDMFFTKEGQTYFQKGVLTHASHLMICIDTSMRLIRDAPPRWAWRSWVSMPSRFPSPPCLTEGTLLGTRSAERLLK